jgi:S-adenosylmethionine hydrolase
MENQTLITLTTDFGSKDPFVGIMKGVMLNINPHLAFIDITHTISPQNILEAALTIHTGFSYFPHRTIHLVVVDPGVGSARRPLLVAADYHYFIGPDNGVFSRIYRKCESLTVIHITSEHYFLPQRGSTFHGRDVFAPAAAWLSKGIHIDKFGDSITDYVSIPVAEPVFSAPNTIEGEVNYLDSFGNVITNIHARDIDTLRNINPAGKLTVKVKEREAPLKNYYSEVEDKGLYSLINSFEYLELFTNRGSASSDFGISVGEKVRVSMI